MSPHKKIYEKKDLNKLQKKLSRHVARAMIDFSMLENEDHVMCCLSGGKDSYTLLEILLYLKRYIPFSFKMTVVNLDQKQPNFPEHILPTYLKKKEIDFLVVEKDTYSIVKTVIPEGKTMCSLCSRLRRGILYATADKIGANKIALGHHREDILETFFLNIFYGGKTKTMPPKLISDDGKHTLIRPLAYCREKDIQRYSDMKMFPIIPCHLCGNQENLQRKVIKKMLSDWDHQYPGRLENIFHSLQDIVSSHMLDKKLFDFEKMTALHKIETDHQSVGMQSKNNKRDVQDEIILIS